MSCDKIQKIATIINKCKNKKSSPLKEDCIYAFVNFLSNNQTKMMTIDVFFDMLETLIERLKQKKGLINGKKIINKLHEFTDENSLDTLIDDLFID
jgi:hypothetical protein